MNWRHRVTETLKTRMMVQAMLGVAVWALTYGSSRAAKLDEKFALVLSFLVAGALLLLRSLSMLEQRQDSVERMIRQIHEDVTTERAELKELMGLVADTAVREVTALKLARNAALIPRQPKLVHDLVDTRISGLSDVIKRIGLGDDVTQEGEDHESALVLVGNAEQSIWATSFARPGANRGKCIVDYGIWQHDHGQRFLDIQQTTRSRHPGMTVRRLFVVDRSDLVGYEDFKALCLLHDKRGAEVRVLDPAREGVTPVGLVELIIFDGVISYELERPSLRWQSQPSLVTTKLIFRPQAVQERTRRFNELWEHATRL